MEKIGWKKADPLPEEFLKAAESAWYCPGRESADESSPCQAVLKTYGITPDTNRRWRSGWGDPHSPVWFIGINPQIPRSKPDLWGEYNPEEWSPDKAVSSYGEGDKAYNAKHYNYHRDIMESVAERLYWPYGDLQERAFVTDIVLCGSEKADLSNEMIHRCAEKHLFHFIRSMKPSVLVPVGLIPFRELWHQLGGSEAERWLPMRKIAGREMRPTNQDGMPSIVPIPQPWMRWKPNERTKIMEQAAIAIAQAVATGTERKYSIKLVVGSIEEVVGFAHADENDEITYSGSDVNLVKTIVEDYKQSKGLIGRALLLAMSRSPQSYSWFKIVNEINKK